jgi:hypothetical protein
MRAPQPNDHVLVFDFDILSISESACAEVPVDEPIPDIPSLALNYRKLVLWFGLQLVFSVGSGTLGLLTQNDDSGRIISMLITLGITIALAIYAYRTARSLGSTAGLVWAIAMLVPCVNAITLLILSRNATTVCRQHGIPVGFFGPRIP